MGKTVTKSSSKELNRLNKCFIFVVAFIQFNVPFKIISLIETSQSIGGRNGSTPGKPPDTPQAELGLSHMWPVRGSNLHQTQR